MRHNILLRFNIVFCFSIMSVLQPAYAYRCLPSASISPREVGISRGRGVQCTPYGKSVPSGPISYRVSDIGEKGIPRLGADDLHVVRLIKRYVHSKTLRFAYVGTTPYEFIVYDAQLGTCADFAPGYFVLNGECNEYYEPGENPLYAIQ